VKGTNIGLRSSGCGLTGQTAPLGSGGGIRLPGNFILCLAVLFLGAGCVRSRPRETDPVLALVGEKKIGGRDFRRELDRLDPSLRRKYLRERETFLNELIEQEVIYQAAAGKGLPQTPENMKRVSRAEADAPIRRLKQQEIYSKISVTEEETAKRYQEEIAHPEKAKIVKSVLYVLSPPGGDVQELVEMIGSGVKEGLSLPETARRNSLPYETIEFDSPRFGELPAQVQSVAVRMNNKSGLAVNLAGTPYYFFKDAQPLSSCFREVGRAIRGEKGERALGEWVSTLRARSTIRLVEAALKDLAKTDAVAAKVNGVPVTVGDVVSLWKARPEKGDRPLDEKAALEAAIDREILRQEAMSKNLQDDPTVKKEVAGETRRILIELLTEQNVTALTPALREKQRAEWLEGMKKAANVRVFPENLKKMHIPPSREIQDVFGGEAI